MGPTGHMIMCYGMPVPSKSKHLKSSRSESFRCMPFMSLDYFAEVQGQLQKMYKQR